FGHAAFLGATGYVTLQFIRAWGLPIELGIVAGPGAALVLGLLSGVVATRRSGIYFALITLGFAQMVYFLVLQMPWTGGEDGLQGVARGKVLGIISPQGTLPMYYFVFAVFLAGFWIIHRTIH